MAQLSRFSGALKIFASAALGLERTVFGSTEQSDDINENLNALQERGWGIVNPNELPAKQDFNAQGWTLARLISYLYQAGIPEWDAAQDYYIGGYVRVGAVLYRSLQNANTNNNPVTQTAFWAKAIPDAVPDATTTVKGIVELATGPEALGGTDTTRAVTAAAMASLILKNPAGFGYLGLAGGVILQWANASISGAASATFNYPMAFPTNSGQIIVCDTGGSTTPIGASPLNLTQFQVFLPSVGTKNFRMMAIGW